MAEDTPTEEAPKSVVPPEIAEALAAIRAEAEAAAAAVVAEVEAEAKRVEAIVAAKLKCAESCGPIAEVLASVTDPRERQALIDLEKRTHDAHAGDLSGAYLAFSGQREGDSNAAAPGTTNIDSHAVATVEPGATELSA